MPDTFAPIARSALHRPAGTVIREVADRATALPPVQSLIDELLAPGGRVVLEAGCGSASRLRLDGASRRLVGIDISATQLERNQELDERVQGDLETYRFPADSFDLIVTWDVLEHLNHPIAALDNLVAAARSGALVVVAVPNLQSLKGLVAKLTPHWVHTATIRRVYPYWPRDQEDIGPFPTKLRRAITAARLRAYAETRGLRVREIVAYESDFQRRLRRLLHLEGRRWEALRRTVAVASCRRLTASGSELLILFEVPSETRA
jgi:SAM-dependent methyltransferase